MRKQKRNDALEAEIQNAVYGYQINIMDIGKVYAKAEDTFAKGQNVTLAVRALLDVIATRTDLWREVAQ